MYDNDDTDNDRMSSKSMQWNGKGRPSHNVRNLQLSHLFIKIFFQINLYHKSLMDHCQCVYTYIYILTYVIIICGCVQNGNNKAG